MQVGHRWQLVSLLSALTLGACDVKQSAAGERCDRSAQCEPGLACIDSVCTDDLDSLAEQGVVPEYDPDSTSESGDGGVVVDDAG